MREQGPGLGAAQLGAELGERATLVQFSSAFCQPCRATRRTLADVAAMVEGVAHVEIDAEENLALVRALDIRATPTVLVLDRTGRIVRRAAGQPRRADVIAALGEAVSGVERAVMDLPHRRRHLTEATGNRQSDDVPNRILLFGRVHVDLARNASARCPGC